MQKYDTVIIGAGPAGFTASLYASRYGLSNIVVGEIPGGTAFEAHKVCNFPSESEIKGSDLMAKMQKNALNTGGEFKMGKVQNVKKQDEEFILTLSNGDKIKAKTILLAIGTKRRRMNLLNENKFLGKGVSYCATCDGGFYKDKNVVIVGGSDAAHTASLYLAEIASSVIQIYRGSELKGEESWKQKVLKNPNIKIIFENEIEELRGDKKLESIILKKEYNGKKELKTDGLFVEIGSVPRNKLAKELEIDLDEKGNIKVNDAQQTSVKNIWAAGDITNASNKFNQIITASAEGAVASNSVFKELARLY